MKSAIFKEVTAWWRSNRTGTESPKMIPIGSFTGDDLWSRWSRVPANQRAALYAKLREEDLANSA